MSDTNILIVNIHSALNAGDRALLECTIKQLRDNFNNPNIILSANWPEENYFRNSGFEIVPSPWHVSGLNTEGILAQLYNFGKGIYYSVQTKRRRSIDRSNQQGWERLFAAYRKADLVVGVAGNQFYSTGRYGWPFPVKTMAVSLAYKFNKPFYTMPQSIGPLRRSWEKKLLSRVYHKARLIQVRDEYSQATLLNIGVQAERIAYAPDPAFDYPSATPDAAVDLLKNYGYKKGDICVGVSVIGTMGHSLPSGAISRYYQVMSQGLRKIITENSVRLFLFDQVCGPTSIENDNLGSTKILQSLSDLQENVIHVNETLSPAVLKACYGLMDIFISSRLHSGIFALGMNVPTLFIGYLSKTRGVLTALGLEDWVIDLDQFSEELFWYKLKMHWGSRAQLMEQLHQIMPGIKLETHKAGQRIAEDFGRHDREN